MRELYCTVGQHPAMDEFILFELLTFSTLQYIQIYVFKIKSQKYRLDHNYFQLLFGSPDLMFLDDLSIQRCNIQCITNI